MEKNEITLDEAIEIIKKVSTRFNRVTICRRCYVFFLEDGNEFNISPKAVIKETGEVKIMTTLTNTGMIDRDEIVEFGKEIDLTK